MAVYAGDRQELVEYAAGCQVVEEYAAEESLLGSSVPQISGSREDCWV